MCAVSTITGRANRASFQAPSGSATVMAARLKSTSAHTHPEVDRCMRSILSTL